MTLVQIAFGNALRGRMYTYRWSGDPEYVKVGDRVIVPANWATPEPSLATVMELGSDYTGKVVDLLGVLTPEGMVGPDGNMLP